MRLEAGADGWRSDPALTADGFAQQVLEWPSPITGTARAQGYGSITVKVARETGGPAVSVRVEKKVDGRWWSVTYVQSDPPEGYTAQVRGSKVALGFDDEGAASVDVEVLYNGRGVSRTAGGGGRFRADLGFRPTTPGHFLILYRDGRGEVFGAFGTTLPAGNFAAG